MQLREAQTPTLIELSHEFSQQGKEYNITNVRHYLERLSSDKEFSDYFVLRPLVEEIYGSKVLVYLFPFVGPLHPLAQGEAGMIFYNNHFEQLCYKDPLVAQSVFPITVNLVVQVSGKERKKEHYSIQANLSPEEVKAIVLDDKTLKLGRFTRECTLIEVNGGQTEKVVSGDTIVVKIFNKETWKKRFPSQPPSNIQPPKKKARKDTGVVHNF